MKKFKIEALTVCVNYSDFLIHAIKYNKHIFDKWVIVTDTKDIKTKELCDKHGLTCVQTDVFYKDGAKFRKYAGINEGLKYLDKDAWICFLDGDIILSPFTRRTLENLKLNKNKIYGIDRFNCTGYERWIKYQKSGGVLLDNWLLHGAGLEWGVRIVHIYGEKGDCGKFTGWKPLGFFQLVHGTKFSIYPEGSEDASHGDLAFAKLWDRSHRELIPEIVGIHLDTSTYKSHNWWGRKSNVFFYEKKVSFLIRLWDRFIIWLNNICHPSYEPMCVLCKLYNRVKRLIWK